jgi:hypothetical protein
LNDKDILSADILMDLKIHLTVAEARHRGVSQGQIQRRADLLRQNGVGRSGKDFQMIRHLISPFATKRKLQPAQANQNFLDEKQR